MSPTRWAVRDRVAAQLLAWSRWLHGVQASAAQASADRQRAAHGAPTPTLAAVRRIKPKESQGRACVL
jgi:hypothetical protein